MSDTPRTDNCEWPFTEGMDPWPDTGPIWVQDRGYAVPALFARRLERELAEAQVELEALKARIETRASRADTGGDWATGRVLRSLLEGGEHD